MADYVQVLDALKAARGAEASPVLAFGGSYGGMLAAWLRLKYVTARHSRDDVAHEDWAP